MQIETENQIGHHSQKVSGLCSVCKRILSLTSTGVIHSHGHGSPCPGSGLAPAQTQSTSLPAAPADTLICMPSSQSNKIRLMSSTQSSTNIQSITDQEAVLNNVVRARCRVLKFVPKASRTLAAAKLSSKIDRTVDNPYNVSAWNQLLLFSYCCFGVSDLGGKRHPIRLSLDTKVNKVLSLYMVGQQPAPVLATVVKKMMKFCIDSSLALRVSSKIEEGDVHGVVLRLAVSDDMMASFNEETVAALRQLHPTRVSSSSSTEPEAARVQALTLTESDIAVAIKSFPAGSAGAWRS